MENVILSDKEIQSTPASSYPTSNEYYILVGCKAGQRKLLRILKEPCWEHPIGDFEHDCRCEYIPFIDSQIDDYEHWHYAHRYLCPDCMAEIEKEIG